MTLVSDRVATVRSALREGREDTMKRMLAAGACAVVLSFALCVGACTSAGVMQFNGKLSEELYVSAESAARGFLENELSAEGIETEFTGYTRERALDEKECSALDLREAKEGLLEAEYGTVRYTERGETWEEACEREVCILTYSLVYRYYVLPVREGERFTRSEYAFLLENGGGAIPIRWSRSPRTRRAASAP